MIFRRWIVFESGTPGLRAYLRYVERQHPSARPGFALVAGLATLLAVIAL